MNIIQDSAHEIPSDSTWVGNIQHLFFGSTNWIYVRRLSQFCGNLRAICDEIEQNDSTKNGKSSELASIRTKIDDLVSWSEAFRLEQSLIHLMDDSSAITELKRRRADLDKFSPKLNAHYQFEIRNELKKNESGDNPVKGLLFRLVKDLQWQELNGYHRHLITNQIIQRINIIFLLSIFLFFLVNIFFFYEKELFKSVFLFVAIVSGIFGASFSMLTSIEARVSTSELDELRSIRSWPSLFTRISAGAGGGLILYFFILSGVVVIPGLPGLDILSGGVPAQNKEGFDAFALFVLLSFIAGFAEKLVPGLIDRATDRLKGKEPEPLDVNP